MVLFEPRALNRDPGNVWSHNQTGLEKFGSKDCQLG